MRALAKVHDTPRTPVPGGKAPGVWQRIVQNRSCYLFLAPFAIVFIVFTVIPVVMAIGLSFTSFNVLEPPTINGWENYRRLLFGDDLFITALTNTLTFSIILGPCGYLLSLTFAWFINELPPKLRSFLTLLFYAPSLANIYVIWKLIFSGDAYGIVNAWLTDLGIIQDPVLWLQSASTLVPVVIMVLLWASLSTSFLAFIAGFQAIDGSLYEAAMLDGATKWQQAKYITLPMLKTIMVMMFILSVGSIFASDFGLFYQVTQGVPNSLNKVASTFDTYVYAALQGNAPIGKTAAVSTFQSVACCITILLANFIVSKIDSDSAVF